MNLVVNKLIQWLHDEAKPTTERVLYIDPSGDVATINVECKTAVPCWHRFDDISFALETRNAVLLEMDDFSPPVLSETEFNTEKYQHTADVNSI